ncbi:MAG: hypothetical protein K6G58_09960 [Lachnospiraceae bacterium]|nr:hypothetical protein [Lachnospiraceae bacterium]
MISLAKNEKIIYRLLTLAVFAAAGLFIYRIVHAGILALPYPKELLEPSNVALTRLFAEGRSPYALSALDWEVPGINYDYPFLNSLLAAAVCTVTGCGAVTAHFAISLFSILMSGVIGFVFAQRYAVTTVTPPLAAILFMFCHWRFGYISAAPDDLGLLLLLVSMLAAVNPRIKRKPIVCAVLITLCFYTKQYFVFIAPCIFIYMLLYSKKDALRFLLYCVLINLAVGVLITVFWPLYWTYSILFMYLGTITGMGNGLATLIEQVSYLMIAFAALFAVLLAAAIAALVKFIRENRKLRSIKFKENDPFTLCAVSIPVMLIPLIFLGRNDGAFISYFLQLWMPHIVIVTLAVIEKIKPKLPDIVFAGIYAANALFVIYFGFGKLPNHTLTAEEAADWEKAYSYVKEYGTDDVFYSRGLAYLSFERGGGQCICGHDAEAISTYTRDLPVCSRPIGTLFPYSHDLVVKNMEYHEMIQKKATDGGYSLITYETPGLYRTLTDEICEENGYVRLDTLSLRLGNMPYETAFYVRAD